MKPKSTARWYYEVLIIAVIIVNFWRIFVMQAFKIPSGSMTDNLLVGDHIVVNKFIYSPTASSLSRKLFPSTTVSRGDVVIFRYPRNPSQDFIKRVVGLPGETIQIRNKEVHIDGRPVAEPWKLHIDPTVYQSQPDLPEPYRSRDQFGPYRIPDDSFFVLGDNRDLSHDSRYWGSVPGSMIKGRAILVYWSFAGRPLPATSPPIAKLRELFTILFTFFEKTRWDRTFHVIDHS